MFKKKKPSSYIAPRTNLFGAKGTMGPGAVHKPGESTYSFRICAWLKGQIRLEIPKPKIKGMFFNSYGSGVMTIPPIIYIEIIWAIDYINPYPEIRAFWRDSPTKPHFGLTNRRLGRYNLPRFVLLTCDDFLPGPFFDGPEGKRASHKWDEMHITPIKWP